MSRISVSRSRRVSGRWYGRAVRVVEPAWSVRWRRGAAGLVLTCATWLSVAACPDLAVAATAKFTVSSISCASPSSCAAWGSKSHSHVDVETFDGQTWSRPEDIGGVLGIASVSCVGRSFCIALDPAENVHVYADGAWAESANVAGRRSLPAGDLPAVSCASRSFCAVIDGGGYTSVFDGRDWRPVGRFDGRGPVTVKDVDPAAVSCTSSGFCMAIDRAGRASRWNGRKWSRPITVDRRAELTAVSCTSRSFCLAVDSRGHDFVFDGRGWSGPEMVAPGLDVLTVTCASSSFCMAGGSSSWKLVAGYVMAYDGHTWSPTTLWSANSLSCPSSSFCAAADKRGAIWTYRGGAWTQTAS
jgi:hypothetical protein